jgi:hypothetical protein
MIQPEQVCGAAQDRRPPPLVDLYHGTSIEPVATKDVVQFLDATLAELMVVQAGDTFEAVAERQMPDVVQQSCGSGQLIIGVKCTTSANRPSECSNRE